MQIEISDIFVGDRARKNPDVAELVVSMRAVGQLQPIILNSSRQLIAGYRRLLAAKEIGWQSIEAVVLHDLSDALLAAVAERDENTCRQPLRPSEMVAVGKRVEALRLTKSAEKPKRKLTDNPYTGEPIRTRDIVGECVGVSGKTYEKAKAVVDSGRKKLIAQMDKTGKVDPAYKKLFGKKKPQPKTITCPHCGRSFTLGRKGEHGI